MCTPGHGHRRVSPAVSTVAVVNETTQPALTSDQAEIAADVLRKMAGPGAVLRGDQERAVAALCEPAARVLVVQAMAR